MKSYTILVIEDDKDIRESVSILLKNAGYSVLEAANGEDGLAFFPGNIDIAIIDIMLPGISGIEVCRRIRTHSTMPVLFLTARSTDMDKLSGFNAGGDDYLVKPFSFLELTARIRSLLRRSKEYNQFADNETISYQALSLGLHQNSLTVNGEAVELTEKEYQILRLMLRHPGYVFSARELFTKIWKEPFLHSSSNTIMVHIRHLRAKIEKDPQAPKIIKTVWGKGYIIEEEKKG